MNAITMSNFLAYLVFTIGVLVYFAWYMNQQQKKDDRQKWQDERFKEKRSEWKRESRGKRGWPWNRR